ncbi:MAG: tetratricopeptide repeat protein [Candidatus Paceibacterota bacterium]|jgi:tetratricopeptide (TPR) repeat protein
MESKRIEFFNRLSFVTLLATIFVSLFFFIPYVPVTLEASKGFLLSVGTTLSVFFWLIARLGEGKFTIPRDRLILFVGVIPLIFLIASFFSSSLYISLFGSGFEMGTFGSMLILFVLFFLSSMYFQTEKRLWYFFGALFLGGLVLSVFELVNMFIGFDRFLPGLLQGISSGNLVGSWNNFALLFGLFILLSLFTLEFLKTKGVFLFVQYFLLVTGLFFLIIINIPLVWLLVAIFSMVIFVYSVSIQHAGVKIVHGGGESKRFPFAALIVMFIGLVFLVGSNSLGGLISKYVNLSNPEVRPSIVTTGQIALKAIKHNPAFGTGPNTFSLDWALWQPKEIASTIFWNSDFSNGYSTLSTFVVTTGILGLLAWIAFFIIFVIRGIQSLRVALKDPLSNYFILTTFMVSLYCWLTFIIYTPNILMLMLAFSSSGILIGILVYRQVIEVRHFSFLNDPRNSFFAILSLMVLMIATLFVSYLYVEKFTSVIYFSKSLNADNTMESLVHSEKMLVNAISLDKNDIYYRTLSEVYVAEIGALVNDKNVSQDTLKSNLQQLINFAQNSASMAVSQNPKQYLNYVNLGNVYASLVTLSVDGSYESAVSSYAKAQALAPNNPSIILAKAQLEFAKKNNDEARKLISQALDLKLNYTDALFLLAQIETSEGNAAGAIKQVERAAQLSPNDSTIFFRLGLLRYNNSDYAGAVSAFEQAVLLDNGYLNARYFLGLSYQKVGRNGDALIQFKILDKVLPDNQDVKKAIDSLSNVSATVAPLAPVTTKPVTKTLQGQ